MSKVERPLVKFAVLRLNSFEQGGQALRWLGRGQRFE
jgi:hypothetical protein